MNVLRIYANFEIEPSEEIKQLTEQELREFILNIVPDAELEVISRKGSWSIVVFAKFAIGWIAEGTASWLLNKKLDYFSEKLSTFIGKKMAKSNNLNENTLASLERVIVKMNDIQEKTGATRLSLGLLHERDGETSGSITDITSVGEEKTITHQEIRTSKQFERYFESYKLPHIDIDPIDDC